MWTAAVAVDHSAERLMSLCRFRGEAGADTSQLSPGGRRHLNMAEKRRPQPIGSRHPAQWWRAVGRPTRGRTRDPERCLQLVAEYEAATISAGHDLPRCDPAVV
jgi:hypothetical protein